jgi:hypothetical protein
LQTRTNRCGNFDGEVRFATAKIAYLSPLTSERRFRASARRAWVLGPSCWAA